MSDLKRAEAFGDLFYAAMMDAALERKLTQLLTVITPEGRTKPEKVRIIIVPETMDMEWSKPLEAK